MALIGWWPLDGNTEDYTVNQNHGVNSNVTWVNGKIGQAGNFNGNNSYIDIINKPELNPGTKDFSISLWLFIPAKGSSYRGIFTKNYTQAFGVFDVTSGFDSVGLYIRSGSNANMINFTDSYGKWTHCVWTVSNSGNIQKSYKNGVFQNQTTHTVGNVTSTNNINIGRYSINGTGYFSGQVNDARLFDHILSQKEINELAKAKVLHYTFNKDEDIIYDGSGYKRNATKVGTPIISSDSKIGSNALLVGLGNNGVAYPASHNLNIRDAITINIWLKRTTEFNQLQDMFLVSRPPSWYFYDAYNGGNIQGEVFIDGVRRGARSTSLPFDGNWYMITYTYNSANQKSSIYKNGILQSEITLTGLSNYLIDASANNFQTGGSFSLGTRGMLIDDTRIYSTALSASDILDLYQTRAKIDNAGNLYANEFVEDYEIQGWDKLKELFEDNNLVTSFTYTNATNDGSMGDANYFTATAQYGGPRSNDFISSINVNDKIYFATNWFATASNVSLVISGNISADTISHNNINNFSFQSKIWTYPTANTSMRVAIYDYRTTGFTQSAFKQLYAINLTSIFGAGREPSKAQVDEHYIKYIAGAPKLTLRSLFDPNKVIALPNTVELGTFTETIGDYRYYTGNNTAYFLYTFNRSMLIGRKYYVVLKTFTDRAGNQAIWFRKNDNADSQTVAQSPDAGFKTMSGIVTPTTFDYTRYSITYYSPRVVGDKYAYDTNSHYFIDLTDIFGSGNEPSQAQMDAWYRDYSISRPKSSGIIKTREFNETDSPTQATKIYKDKIKLKGSLKEG